MSEFVGRIESIVITALTGICYVLFHVKSLALAPGLCERNSIQSSPIAHSSHVTLTESPWIQPKDI